MSPQTPCRVCGKLHECVGEVTNQASCDYHTRRDIEDAAFASAMRASLMALYVPPPPTAG